MISPAGKGTVDVRAVVSKAKSPANPSGDSYTYE